MTTGYKGTLAMTFIMPPLSHCNIELRLSRVTAAELAAARLQWKRSGNGWLLYLGRRRFGRVVPDAKWPGMFRSVLSSGGLSDMANLAWAKNAVLDAAMRELEWEARNEAATDHQKTQQNGGVFRDAASPVRFPPLSDAEQGGRR
jgi:hypothetical protein